MQSPAQSPLTKISVPSRLCTVESKEASVDILTNIHRRRATRDLDRDVLCSDITAAVRCTADQRSSLRIQLLGSYSVHVLDQDVFNSQIRLGYISFSQHCTRTASLQGVHSIESGFSGRSTA